MRCAAAILLLLLPAALCAQESAPSPIQPATQAVPWGKEDSELRARISTVGETLPKGPVRVKLELQNRGEKSVDLAGAFAWLFVKLGPDEAVYTAKLPASGQRPPPTAPAATAPTDARLAGESILETTLDFSDQNAFEYDRSLQVVDGFPQAVAGTPRARGKLPEILPRGKVLIRGMVYIPDKRLLLVTNTLPLRIGRDVAIPATAAEYKALSAADREAVTAAFHEAFSADAVAGQNAHDRAVKIGPGLTLELMKIPAAGFTAHGQMWYAATLLDLGDHQALPTVLKLLQTGPSGTKSVIAYKGPGWKEAKLDEAIQAAAEKQPAVAAWTARGYAMARRTPNADFLQHAMTFADATARIDIAPAIVADPTPANQALLVRLLADPDHRVRLTTASAIAHTEQPAKLKTRSILAALVAALDKPEEAPRPAVCEALEKLTAQHHPYNPKATEDQKQQAIKAWQTWWSRNENTLK